MLLIGFLYGIIIFSEQYTDNIALIKGQGYFFGWIMKGFRKAYNLALIFILIEAFLCQDLYALRVPMNGYEKVKEALASGETLEQADKDQTNKDGLPSTPSALEKKKGVMPWMIAAVKELQTLVPRLTKRLERQPNMLEVTRHMKNLPGDNDDMRTANFRRFLKTTGYTAEHFGIQLFSYASDAAIGKNFSFSGFRLFIPDEISGKAEVISSTGLRGKADDLVIRGTRNRKAVLELHADNENFRFKCGDIESVKKRPGEDEPKSFIISTISACIAFRDKILGIPVEFGLDRKIALMKWLLKDGIKNDDKVFDIRIGGDTFFFPSYYRTYQNMHDRSRIIVYTNSGRTRVVALVDRQNPENFFIMEIRDGNYVSSESGEILEKSGKGSKDKRTGGTRWHYDLSKCSDFSSFHENVDKSEVQVSRVSASDVRNKLLKQVSLLDVNFTFYPAVSMDLITVETARSWVAENRANYPIVLETELGDITISVSEEGSKEFTVSGLNMSDGRPIILTEGRYFNLSVILEMVRLGLFKDLVAPSDLLMKAFTYTEKKLTNGRLNPITVYKLDEKKGAIEPVDLIDPADLKFIDIRTGKINEKLRLHNSVSNRARRFL